ncbi:MAG TPA: prepilin-type N-terminal cleavage/methylation domain-containing protein [Acidiferrobacter sp.]|nr:prepilin-type N-terminal cleavage/methylation domain-containing protein [Acidiferrobacter sp.]
MRESVKMRRPHRVFARCGGFTLIENMVALAIFAIGIMAVVFLLLEGMAMSKGGQSLTQAYIAAQEMVGMLRADANGGNALGYNGINTVLPAGGVGATGVELANITTWEESLAYLPGLGGTTGGRGTVAVKAVGVAGCPCEATVTVYWTGGLNSYVLQTMVGY